ncbi:MAG: hypothetical protein H6P94_435 [Thermoplasmatales archaeon]|nr:hypothetical protein [Thermoplasmatales archaeon]
MVVVEEMKRRTFGMQNKAVAGVIEALLMVALVSIVLSVVQLVYIPEVMEQRESEHMDLVSNQISTLKSMIDLQGVRATLFHFDKSIWGSQRQRRPWL